MEEYYSNSIFPPDIRRLGAILIVFFSASVITISGGFFYPNIGVDWEMILYSNIILLAINLLAYILVRVSMRKKNPNVFVRSVMGAVFLKMVIVIALIVSYVTITKGNFHKPSLLIVMGLYLLYLAALCYCLIIYSKNINDIEEQKRSRP